MLLLAKIVRTLEGVKNKLPDIWGSLGESHLAKYQKDRNYEKEKR